MKKLSTTAKILALSNLFALLFIVDSCLAQSHTVKIDPIVQKNIDQVKDVYNNVKPKNLVADYSFRDTLQKFQGQASGIVIKNGQVQNISTVLDDKSLTFNYAFRCLNPVLFQPTITGTSSKGVIDLFTGNKFARTISLGANITISLPSHARFWPDDREHFRLALKDTDERYLSDGSVKYQTLINKIIDKLKVFVKLHGDFFKEYDVIRDYKLHFESERELKLLLSQLKDYYPENLDLSDENEVKAFIEDLIKNSNNLITYVDSKRRLAKLDSVQTNAPWTHFTFQWLTISPKINQKDSPIYDPTAAGSLFTKTDNDYYPSLAMSYNILWSFEKSKVLIYPGFAIQNNRVYVSSDSLSVNIQHPLNAGVDSVQIIKSTGFFAKRADRKLAFTVNLPIMYSWSPGIGIDAGTAYKIQSQANDFSVHLGFFFSVPTKDGQTITLEPLFKYDNDKSQTYAHNFDKFSFGINLSFALPGYIANGKK